MSKKNEGKSSFVLYFDLRTPLELLSDEEKGRLFTAIFDYAEYGRMPEFDGALIDWDQLMNRGRTYAAEEDEARHHICRLTGGVREYA